MATFFARRLGFDGLTITDALDMHALAQGAAQVVDVISAVRAGQDLLLATPDPTKLARIDEGLSQAELRGLLPDGSGARRPGTPGRAAGVAAWVRAARSRRCRLRRASWCWPPSLPRAR